MWGGRSPLIVARKPNRREVGARGPGESRPRAEEEVATSGHHLTNEGPACVRQRDVSPFSAARSQRAETGCRPQRASAVFASDLPVGQRPPPLARSW